MKKLLVSLLVLLPVISYGQSSAFVPSPGGPVTLTVGTSTSSIQVPNPNSEGQIRIFNSCTTTLFIKSGSSSVTAANTDMAIAPGAVEVFTIWYGNPYIAGIVNSGSCDVYLLRGTGV